MPKKKTKKSLAKRFKITKTGKVIRGRSFSGHLKAGKSKRRRKRLSKQTEMKGSFAKKVKKYMGVRKPKKQKEEEKDAKSKK